MKQFLRKMLSVFLGGVLAVSGVLAASTGAWAADCGDGVETTLLGENGCYDAKGKGVYGLLGTVIDVFVILVGVLGVIGIVISGIQYLTSGGDVGKMTKAKNRLLQVVIGLIAFGLMSAFLEFLVPGGIF